jgi:hypothetical protein
MTTTNTTATEIDHNYTICIVGTETRPHYLSEATMLYISSNYQSQWAVCEHEFAQNVKWAMTPGNRMMLMAGTAPGSPAERTYNRIVNAVNRARKAGITAYEVVALIRAEEAAKAA